VLAFKAGAFVIGM